MAARLAETEQGTDLAIRELERGLHECGDEPGLLRELARLLHSQVDYNAALQALERLTGLTPDDASAWHNRGVVLSLLHRIDEAKKAFQKATEIQSSQVRPADGIRKRFQASG